MSEIPLPPELLGIRGRVVRGGGGRDEGGVLIRVGASLRESHPLVQAGRPERLEGQVLGAHRSTGALAAPRARPVLPPARGGEHPLGTLKDAAHARATSPATDATTLLLRLRPPGTRTLQATYCDRAFDLAPGLDSFCRGMTVLPVVGSSLVRFSRQAPAGPEFFKVHPSSLPLFFARPQTLLRLSTYVAGR